MPVTPKEPLDWLLLFRQQINVLLNVLSGIDHKGKSGEHECTPRVDVYETSDGFVVELDLPGFQRSDLSVSVCCSTLIIEGTKQKERRVPGASYLCMERCFGRFCKTIEIPPSVDSSEVSAQYEKGVLTIRFPRPENANMLRRIPIG